MDAHQLVNSLTSHIALYHQSSLIPNSDSNPRSAILRWFSSLTLDQRQAHLTTVDPSFVRLLLRMQTKLKSHGHGFFFVLPDLPSPHSPSLPSLCYRKSRGLLSRVSELNDLERSVSESVLLFGSKEGENVNDCCCYVEGLDSITVCEDFVANVDSFVAAMDRVSNGEFLRGEESGLGADWVETKWLKAKGYYSIEAFVASRLEISLRLAWLNCIGGKRKGGKLKDKATAASAGVAINVFRRKKGCVDWWGILDGATQTKVFSLILGTSMKYLVDQILKGANDGASDEKLILSVGAEQSMRYNSAVSSPKATAAPSANAEVGVIMMSPTLSGKLNPISHALNRLLVLEEILTLFSLCQLGGFNKVKFFSTLSSVRTISDCVLQKLRGLLMAVSLDWTKHELLGEESSKSSHQKLKASVGSGKRRKKGRNRTIKEENDVPSFQGGDLMRAKCLGENADGLVGEETQCSARKNRKGTKNKSHSLIEKETILMRGSKLSSSNVSVSGVEKSCSESSSSFVQNITSDVLSGIIDPEPNERCIYEDDFVDFKEGSCNPGLQCDQMISGVFEKHSVSSRSNGSPHTGLENRCLTDALIGNGIISTRSETSSSFADSNVTFDVKSALECDIESKENVVFSDSGKRNEGDKKLALSVNSTNDAEIVKTVLFKEQGNGNHCDNRPRSSEDCPSHKWPCLSSKDTVQIPTTNPQYLPAATDVGHNCHNHLHQAFIPGMHKATNTPIESGCRQILSHQLPMSLDWPPMMRSLSGPAPSLTYSYDSGLVSRAHSSFWQGFTTNNIKLIANNNGEKKYPSDHVDMSDLPNALELADEYDSHWLSEEELEMRAVSGVDYSQYFGGGVMYWNPSDNPGTGFSRPPSLSSDDSSLAWREADMNRAVDDMVAFSSSYSANGLTSPTASPFCSSRDALGPVQQTLGYVMPANEVTSKVRPSSLPSDSVVGESSSGSLASLSGDIEVKSGDSLPYPILRPIIIPNLSRERSRSEFRHGHERKSPCVPPVRREQPRIKRPPSPVVLCVPRAPHPSPPSPASDSRKPRGFSTVRSGSSSPRHWGMRGWYQDGSSFEEAPACVDGTELVWPSWRNKNLPAHPVIQPLTATLLQDRLMAISQLTRDKEHPDVAFPLQPADLSHTPSQKASLSLMHSLLHDEIDSFCKRVAAENAIRKPYINWAVKRVTRSLQVLWPRSRSNIFGSNATGLSLPSSDVDLVVCLPPVRNLEPIKEAGILEGRNGIKETCLQHAARYLANQEWVKNDSLKTVENTAIPIIMLVAEVPRDLIASCASNSYTSKDEPTLITHEQEKHVHTDLLGLQIPVLPKCSEMNYDNGIDLKAIRLDISFKSSSHTGLETTELVKELTNRFPAVTPLALVLKKFLADRSLDQSYSGGLSSYCLVLLIIRFIQHQHHLGRPVNQNYGSLLMDFLYFFGNVFDPRQMRISVLGSGVYMKREKGYSIDPIHIDDPLFPTNNVGRNCFRIHQCIKAFSDAFSVLENELTQLCNGCDPNVRSPQKVLHKIVPSIDVL